MSGVAARTLALVFVLSFPRWACAQAPSATASARASPDENALADDVNDPTAILAQLKFQDIYRPRSFGTTAQTNRLQIRAVLPFARSWLVPVDQVMRPTLEIETLATGPSSSTITELRDMQFFDLFVSRWPDPPRTGLRWSIGPTFVFPTATDPAAGAGAWQMGPAASVVYRGIPGFRLGFLFQNPISFAYTSSDRSPQSRMLFQPVISYRFARGWYVKFDPTWTINWRHNTSTTIPIRLGVGRAWRFGGPDVDTFVAGEWTAYRQFAPRAPMYAVRFGVSLLFPGWSV